MHLHFKLEQGFFRPPERDDGEPPPGGAPRPSGPIHDMLIAAGYLYDHGVRGPFQGHYVYVYRHLTRKSHDDQLVSKLRNLGWRMDLRNNMTALRDEDDKQVVYFRKLTNGVILAEHHVS